ncbi:hypothetical protein [Qipengyuania sp.]|uniref:hypothetical protein n=1 Tax=Qipengyuania sp. TaxID=2004515 RepID=UPI0035C87E3D
MEFIEANWLLILLVVVTAVAIFWYIFHAARRTRVTGERRDVLDQGAAPAARNQALIDAPPASAAPRTDRVEPAPRPDPSPVTAPAAMASAPTGLAGAGEAARFGSAAAAMTDAQEPQADSDDLTQIKGVGPKLAAILQGLGINSFAQIAKWDEAEIDRVDSQLGRFQGRIRRDAWVEQAKFLASGDDAGYAARFGNNA